MEMTNPDVSSSAEDDATFDKSVAKEIKEEGQECDGGKL